MSEWVNTKLIANDCRHSGALTPPGCLASMTRFGIPPRGNVFNFSLYMYLIASIGAKITDISSSSFPRSIPLYCDSATIEAESAGRLST